MSARLLIAASLLLAAACSPAAPTAEPEKAAPAPAVPAATLAPAASPAPPPASSDAAALNAFVERGDICGHFAGEEPFDDARARQINAAMDANRCETLEADAAALRARYAGKTAELARIAEAMQAFEP